MHRLGLIRLQNATHHHVVAVIILIIVITAIAMFKFQSPICDATTFYNETQPSHMPSQKLSDSFRSGQNVLPENGPPAKMMQNYVVPAAAGGGCRIKAASPQWPKIDP